MKKALLMSVLLSLSAAVLSSAVEAPKAATEFTKKHNEIFGKGLNFKDRQDFEDASRGLVAAPENFVIKSEKGETIWDLTAYGFLKEGDAPPTVNPSLWRIAQLNMNYGLFEVVKGYYQIRGFDLSNMNIVEGDKGLLIMDPLISPECAKAGLDLYYKTFPEKAHKKVVAVLYTHSHIDHYGGVRGIVDEADVKSGKVKIIAPQGFLEEATSENVYAGTAMARRSLFQYGTILPHGEKGQVDAGLGKAVSHGRAGLIAPTITIKKTGETLKIDGIDMEFMMAPNTEAPAEMLIYFPKFRVLCAAEDCTHTMHNLYTLRGAQVRDSKTWWKTLDAAIEKYGDKADALVAQHHWPVWGKEAILQIMRDQRDMFKFTHDKSLNLINKGYTMLEVAEMIKLPDSIGKRWYNRGYYGSLNHNAKAVYQRYIGWYSSNPADLYALPPEDSAKKYIEFMGGADAVIKKAKESFEKGEYRWVAQVMNHAVFADPENMEARKLEADALEQLGYQQENPTWRNEFLMGANELRNGKMKDISILAATPDTIRAMSMDMIFDYMGIRLNTDKAAGKKSLINVKFGDTKEKYLLTLNNSVLIYTPNKNVENADETMEVSSEADFALMIAGIEKFDDLIKAGKIKFTPNSDKFKELLDMLDDFKVMFNVVTP